MTTNDEGKGNEHDKLLASQKQRPHKERDRRRRGKARRCDSDENGSGGDDGGAMIQSMMPP